MDPEPIHKIINSLRKRGLVKEANILEEIFVTPPKKVELVTQCPICGSEPDPECLLCEGSGELISQAPDDEEDQRVQKELGLKEE